MPNPTQIVKNLRDSIVRFTDGSGTPKTWEAVLLNGDFSYTETNAISLIDDRRSLHSVRLGEEVPISWSFSAKHYEITSGTALSLVDIITGRGYAAGAGSWVTTGAAWEPYMFKMLLKFINPDPAGNDEYLEMERCIVQNFTVNEGLPYNNIAFTGIAHITTPVVVQS